MCINHYPTFHLALKQILFLLSLCLLPMQATAETREQQQFIQQRLEYLHVGTDKKIGSDTLYTSGLLVKLYEANQFKLIWTQQDTVDQLLASIRGCVQEGLVPDDYHLQAITTSGAILKTRPSFAGKVDYDLLLSDALVLLGNHKSYGKVDSGKVKERFDLAMSASIAFRPDFYLESIRLGTVGETLENLSPDYQQYVDLKLGLAKYLKIASNGGWPSVPLGPTLKPGMRDDRVLALRTRLIVTGELLQLGTDPSFFDTDLSVAIKSFQTQHYIDADGMPGKSTLAAMNRTVSERIGQIRVNLERSRWVLRNLPPSYLIVDIAGYSVQYYQNGNVTWSSKVIVGQPVHQTPIIRSAVTCLVLNPTWTIPSSIIKNETIPEIIKNRSYLKKQLLRVLKDNGDEIDPSNISWKQYLGKPFPYMIRQDAGEDNSLGLIKFIFPNMYQVYLHDTPSKMLFAKTSRAFSHGCIRTQHPMELGKLLIANDLGNPIDVAQFDQILASGRTTTVSLKQHLPIFLVYWTTSIHEGKVWFVSDIYRHDQNILTALDGPPSFIMDSALVQKPYNRSVIYEVMKEKG